MVIYGVELMKPIIHEFLLQMAGVAHTLSSIPRAVAKVRLAPLEAANISTVIKVRGINPTRLIPSLDCSCNGVEDDGHVENPRVPPLVRDFLVQNASILLVELLDLIDMVRALCYQRALDEVVTDIAKIVVGSELLDIRDQLRLGDSGERVLDSPMVSAQGYRGD
jgi:hypothetical protein